MSASRAGFLDFLNVGGAVASQADVLALNQSASRRVILQSVQHFERPETGTTSYTIEARTYDGDGAAVNADTTPTLAVTGRSSGDLAANLGAATNPATGLYRWTYTVEDDATVEELRFDISATIGSSAFPLSLFAQVCDQVAVPWTTADRVMLTELRDDWADGGRLDSILDGRASQASVDDVPTNPEFEARTLPAANYFDPAADTVANVSTVGTVTDKAGFSLSSAGILAIWSYLTSGLAAVTGSFGKFFLDRLDVSTGSRSSHTPADVVDAINSDPTQQDLQTNAATAATQSADANANAAAASSAAQDAKASAESAASAAGSAASAASSAASSASTAAATATKLESMVEQDGPVYRFTQNALERAPVGEGAGGGGEDTGGSNLIEIFGYDADTNAPVAGVKVRFRKSDGSQVGALRITDDAGEAVDQLDDGTWIVTATKTTPPYEFDPLTVEIDGDRTVSLELTPVAIPAPPSELQTTGYLYCFNGHGDPTEATIAFRILRGDGTAGHAYEGEPVYATSDATTGLLFVTLAANTHYVAEWIHGSKKFTSGDGPTFAIPEIIGRAVAC